MKTNFTHREMEGAVAHKMHGMPSEQPMNAVAHSGHTQHSGHSAAMFRDKFWLSLALTFPVVFWSEEVQRWLGYNAPSVPGSRFIPAILGTIILVYGGRVFVQGAWRELSGRQPGMMTLISLAIVVAFTASLAATLGIFQVEVWWELSTLITVMLLGHWQEMKAVAQAKGALHALAALLPDNAVRVTESGVEKVPLTELRVGDVVLVRPGSRVPADGVVMEGTADVDESMITGESRAVSKGPGAAVVAGTVAVGGSLRVQVKGVGEQTALSGVMRLVAAAQASGSRAQALADRAATLLFYVALVSGVLTFGYWWLAGDSAHALTRTATVLIIACPHALGLAIPLVIAISTSLGARNGLLVKDRLALERSRDLDVVVFDKTGTLTRGAPALSGVVVATGVSEDYLLSRAAAVEGDSEHPLAKVIVAEAKRRGLPSLPASQLEALPGRGAQALVGGENVAVGGPHLLSERNIAAPPELAKATETWAADGKTVLFVVSKNSTLGAFAVEDEIRPESKEAAQELHRLGIRVAMIKGDSRTEAGSVARRIGIDDVAAEVFPADKASAIQRFQAGGKYVAMVG